MAHALETQDVARTASVVAGFTTELLANPGLEKAWRACEFGRDHVANAVLEEMAVRTSGAGTRPLH